MTGPTLTWDVARVGGVVAYILLTASVAVGIALSLGWRSPRWTRYVTNDMHRFVTLVALVFTGIHTIAVAVDPFMAFTPAEVAIPMVSHYRPVWVALGIVGAYLLAAIYASEWIRPRVGYRWWRRFHYLSFAAFVLALVHGVATGSDTRAPWAVLLYASSVVLVGALLVARLIPAGQGTRHPVVAALAAALLVLGIEWAAAGPLQPGWNAIANNGNGSGASRQALAALGITSAARASVGGTGAGPSSAGSSPVGSPMPAPATPVQASFQARVYGGDDDSLTLLGQLEGAAGNQFLVQLSGQGSTSLGQVQVQGADGRTCSGPVTGEDNTSISATCATTDGASWAVRIVVHSVERRTVAGTFSAIPAGATGTAPGGGAGS